MRFFRSKAVPATGTGETGAPPGQETQRLVAVRQLRLLDTAREERFDRFTRLASAALQMPVALLSLVDDQREWFKSALGLRSLREVPRSQSFASAVFAAEGRIMVLRDASKDRRFAAHPLVQGPDGLRFFAGLALSNGDGVKVGILAVMDRKPRDFSADKEQTLGDLALLAEQELRGLPLRDTLERLAQAERRAEEQHSRFAVFMENLPNIAFLKDSDGRTIFGNRFYQQIFGVQLSDVIGKRDDEWLPTGVAVETMAADREVIETGVTRQVEEIIPTVLGLRHWLTFKFPVPTPSGERLLGGIAVDITAQKRIEQELQELFTLQHAIVHGASFGIVSTEPDGTIRTFNTAMERMLGYRADEVIGRARPDLWHDRAELQGIADEITRATGTPVEPTSAILRWGLEPGAAAEHELTFIRQDGSKFLGALAITALRSAEGEITGYVGMLQDITSRFEAQAAQDRARQAAEAANRAKSQFVANMSHEVRTPLNGVIGVTAMLLETELQPAQRQLAEIVMTSADGLLSIVNDILDFSKIEAGRTELESVGFDLPALLQSVAELQIARANEKWLAISREIDPDVPTRLQGDPLRLRQVLNNLVGNAIKFSDHGQIRLVVRVERLETEKVSLCFDVIDCGVGIPPEKHQQIFEPFTQADVSTTRIFGGTGLGLSICRQLVELMGGRIGVQSELGQGADFWFTASFGLVPESAPEAAHQPAPEPEPLTRLNVLLAEDSAINRLVATHQLHKLGCEVEAVENGQQAIEAAATIRFDLVLMDCQMPGVDGYEATAAIREREVATGRHTRIIAITANAMEGERERCLAAGMDGYLSKPFKPEELHRLIATVMQEIAPEEIVDRPEINPFDPQTLTALRRECQDGEGDLFAQYVTFFLEDVAEAENCLTRAFEQHDLDAFRRTAHRLRGAAANFGASRLMSLCARMEKHAAAGQTDETLGLFEPLESEIARVKAALEMEAAAPVG